MRIMSSQEERDGPYKVIYVKPGGGDPQVTFDNNHKDNQWFYHPGKHYNDKTEVFHIVRIEGLKVKIKGHHCDGIPDMILSVKEDEDGKPEPPRFRTKEESEPDNIHTVFTQEDDKGMTAFSFMTNHNNSKVYLVPRSEKPFRIRSKITDDPQYVFKIGPEIQKTMILISVSTWQCDDEGQYELM